MKLRKEMKEKEKEKEEGNAKKKIKREQSPFFSYFFNFIPISCLFFYFILFWPNFT